MLCSSVKRLKVTKIKLKTNWNVVFLAPEFPQAEIWSIFSLDFSNFVFSCFNFFGRCVIGAS